MTRFFQLLFLSVAMMPTVHLHAAPIEDPVSITAELVANEKDSNQFTLEVSLDIKDGWFTYDVYDDSENSSTNTTVDLELPEGAKQVGEWDRPLSKPKDGSPETDVFTGQANFSCKITADEDVIGQKIEVTVSYQACNDKYCNRPTSKTLSVEIKDSTATKKAVLKNGSKNGSSARVDPAEKKTAKNTAPKKISKEKISDKTVFVNELFEAPVRLMSDGKPLEARDSFPSPAIYDIDGDGVNEMTVGGLRGNLEVFEDSNKSGQGEPIWKSRGSLKDSDGKRIKLTNW